MRKKTSPPISEERGKGQKVAGTGEKEEGACNSSKKLEEEEEEEYPDTLHQADVQLS